MPIEARRTFRLAGTVSLALAIAYASGNSTPYIAPLLAFILTAKPEAPMPPAKLLVMAVALAVILATGLVIAPLIAKYPPVGLLLVVVGLTVSSRLSLAGESAAVGTLLAMGLTLISALGVVSLALAQTLVVMLVIGVVIAVVSQWLVYPFFPEAGPSVTAPDSAPSSPPVGRGMAWRSVVVTLPAYLFLLVNPTGHTPVMMKSILLSQSESVQDARESGLELLGSTCLGGLLAVVLWFGLQIAPRLDIFALWVLLAMVYIGKKLYVPGATRFSSQFWIDTGVTLLIALGPAVADSLVGKDPYQAFLFRFGMFLLVAIYAWAAMVTLNKLGWFRAQPREVTA